MQQARHIDECFSVQPSRILFSKFIKVLTIDHVILCINMAKFHNNELSLNTYQCCDIGSYLMLRFFLVALAMQLMPRDRGIISLPIRNAKESDNEFLDP